MPNRTYMIQFHLSNIWLYSRDTYYTLLYRFGYILICLCSRIFLIKYFIVLSKYTIMNKVNTSIILITFHPFSCLVIIRRAIAKCRTTYSPSNICWSILIDKPVGILLGSLIFIYHVSSFPQNCPNRINQLILDKYPTRHDFSYRIWVSVFQHLMGKLTRVGSHKWQIFFSFYTWKKYIY